MDSGVDSDLGIYINGGTLLASGNMYDEIAAESAQNFIVLNFNEKQHEEDLIVLKNSDDEAIAAFYAVNDYTVLVYSSDQLAEGDYTAAKAASVTGESNGSIYTKISDADITAQLEYSTSGGRGMGHGGFGMKPAGMNEDDLKKPDGEKDENRMGKPEGDMKEPPENGGEMPQRLPDFNVQDDDSEKLTSFTLSKGGTFLYSVAEQK